MRERLWVRPLAVCLLSIAAVLAALLTDTAGLHPHVPEIGVAPVRTLLSLMASNMLVVATFAVGAMLAAYASASNSATPRSFPLVLADDISQNALSTFIGTFIFSVVALTAMEYRAFETAGLFTLFVITTAVFSVVVLVFIRWVDRVARLGRLSTTIEAVEAATAVALQRRMAAPTLGAVPYETGPLPHTGQPVYPSRPGYVRHIDVSSLQAWAEEAGSRVRVLALPGTFVGPGRPLAHVAHAVSEVDVQAIVRTFDIGRDRTFGDDPRFGLVVLSEIAGRALSPAINDPGTAIQVLGAQVRLLSMYGAVPVMNRPVYPRVEAQALSPADLCDDAFTAIARDGAGCVEVAVRLQKALHLLAAASELMREAARRHQRISLARCRQAMTLPDDLTAVKAAAEAA